MGGRCTGPQAFPLQSPGWLVTLPDSLSEEGDNGLYYLHGQQSEISMMLAPASLVPSEDTKPEGPRDHEPGRGQLVTLGGRSPSEAEPSSLTNLHLSQKHGGKS